VPLSLPKTQISDALAMQTSDQGTRSIRFAERGAWWRILGCSTHNGEGAEVDKRIRLIGVPNIKGLHLATLESVS
jgi:hypothetical protein